MRSAKQQVGCSGSRRRLPQGGKVAFGIKSAVVFLVRGPPAVVPETSAAAHGQELVVHGGRSHERGGPKPEA